MTPPTYAPCKSSGCSLEHLTGAPDNSTTSRSAEIVKLTRRGCGNPSPTRGSNGGGGLRPCLVSVGSRLTHSRSAVQVRLGVEGIVDRGVGGKEPLRLSLVL